MKMEELEQEIRNCKKCSLYKNANKAVPGSGDYSAEIMFVGEAPGKNEDKEGKPFVGRAGKILDELLENIGLERKEVFISNIVKHRPPENRDPTNKEIKACVPYLDKQIDKIKPKVLAPLGRFAMEYILSKYEISYGKISEDHGTTHKVNTLFGTMEIIPLYHPAVVLYQRSMKEKLDKDFEKLKNVIDRN